MGLKNGDQLVIIEDMIIIINAEMREGLIIEMKKNNFIHLKNSCYKF